MFRSASLNRGLNSILKSKFVAQCDGLVDANLSEEGSLPTLVEQVSVLLLLMVELSNFKHSVGRCFPRVG